jgi:hypothetical protein
MFQIRGSTARACACDPFAGPTDNDSSNRTEFVRHDKGSGESGRVGDAPDERPVAQSITGNDWPTLLVFGLIVASFARLRFSAIAAQMPPKEKGGVIAGCLESLPSARRRHDFARVEFDLGDHEIDQLCGKPRLVQDFPHHGMFVISSRHSACRGGAANELVVHIYTFALELGLRPAFLAAYARLSDALSLAFCSGVHVRAVAAFGTAGDVAILVNAASAASRQWS